MRNYRITKTEINNEDLFQVDYRDDNSAQPERWFRLGSFNELKSFEEAQSIVERDNKLNPVLMWQSHSEQY